uniref:Uncharacterized protein n=1 Tax=Aegilops tauschii TaxID=37682 RepID=M8C8J7_AEGTA
MASGLYPLARAEALSGLAAVLKKVNAGGGVVECCYACAEKSLRDEDEGIRLAAVRLVGLCAEKFAMREELGGDGDQMDRVFLQVWLALRAGFGVHERNPFDKVKVLMANEIYY